MVGSITVDCIGSNVLSITDEFAVHNVPLNSQVIYISEESGETEYRPSQLPLNYKVDSLGGRLNIHDGKGRLIYCWRSLEQHQRRWRSPSLGRGRGRRSRSPREPAWAGIQMRTPVSSRASPHTQSGTSRPQCSKTTSGPPFPTFKQYDSGSRPDLTSNSVDHDSFQPKREGDSVTKNELIDLTEDEKDCLSAPAMTEEDRRSLLQITNNLMKTRISRRIRDSVNHDPSYSMVIKEPMDLWTLRRKLIDGGYASLQEYKRDFRLIIDNALQWYEPDSDTAKDVQALNAKFEEKMLSLSDMRDPEYKTPSDPLRSPSPDNGPDNQPLGRTRELPPRAAKRAVHTYRDPALGDFLWYEKKSRPNHW